MAPNNEIAVVCCSGSFFTAAHFQGLVNALQKKGVAVEAPTLPSNNIIPDVPANGQQNPAFDVAPPASGWPNGAEDVAAIQELIAAHADAGKKVIVVGHSYGGFVATQSASPELQYTERQRQGKRGGVIGIFYAAGVILPEGIDIDTAFTPHGDSSSLPPLVTPHAPGKVGAITPIDGAATFFSDLPEEQAKQWASELRAQPVITTPLTNPSYAVLPFAYLFCRNDKAIPHPVQEILVKTATDAGGKLKEYYCDQGHAPMTSNPTIVADSIENFASSL